MDSQKQQVVDRIKQANNILVTVSANPSVDQLAACVGLTIMLNELGKHATAVFSGAVPSTIEFLQPEKTLEKNTDSLRDFIIALDKSKADKLRYKVEDKAVKIFITPYRTSIGEKDLEFSQGDFNVDVVVCLGVHEQKDLDQAITSHGRILHDATVIGVNTTAGNNVATLNWQNSQASSLSEMVASLVDGFDKKVLDTQIATALLTGVVAETDRFSNGKTSPDTMKVSAQLMAEGANQQLVATKLEAPPPPPPEPPQSDSSVQGGNDGQQASATPPKPDDGTLRIDHHDHDHDISLPPVADNHVEQAEHDEPEVKAESEPKIHIDENGRLRQLDVENRQFLGGPEPGDEQPNQPPAADEDEDRPSGAPRDDNPKFVMNPPTLGGTLTANSRPEALDPLTDPLSLPNAEQPLLNRNSPSAASPFSRPPVVTSQPASVAPQPAPSATVDDTVTANAPSQNNPSIPVSPSPAKPQDHQKTLAQIEEAVSSPHIKKSDVNSARSAVETAVNNAPPSNMPPPIAALGAQPLGGDLHHEAAKQAPVHPEPTLANTSPPNPSTLAQPLDLPLPPTLAPPPASATPPTSSGSDGSSSAPPVPPPMMPMPPLISPTGQ